MPIISFAGYFLPSHPRGASLVLTVASILEKGVVKSLKEVVRGLFKDTASIYLILVYLANRMATAHKGAAVQERFWRFLSSGFATGAPVFIGLSIYRNRILSRKERGKRPELEQEGHFVLFIVASFVVTIFKLYVDGGLELETLEYMLSVPAGGAEALQSVPGYLM